MKQSDKTFLMQKQWRKQINYFSAEQKAQLFDAIYDYHCDGKDFETDDGMLKIMWSTMRQAFEYNISKYEEMCEKNRINGAKSHKKEKANATECSDSYTFAYDRNRSVANGTLNDNDNDNENENENDNDNDNKNEIETETKNKKERNN